MIRRGGVYFVAGVPALDEFGAEKDRYAIVIDLRLEGSPRVIPLAVMCVISSASTLRESRIELPSHAGTGFRMRCWAVPEWIVLIPPCWLTQQTGSLSRLELKPVADRVKRLIGERYYEQHPPLKLECPPPPGRTCEHCHQTRRG